MKAILIGIALCVLFDAAAFRGDYRDAVAGAGVRLAQFVVTSDWNLTHT